MPDSMKSPQAAAPATQVTGNGLARQQPAHAFWEPAAAASQALGMLAVPAFLLRADCVILACNAAGKALLERSPAFVRHQDRLAIRRTNDAVALAEAVARAVARQEPELLRFLTRQEEASALMRIAPLAGESMVTVCISELRSPLLLDAGWSRTAFGFSPQNASLAESLAIGRSLADFAADQKLPIGTVRTRLKKLLQQTGTSSQAQLAAMLLRASVAMSGLNLLPASRNGRKPPRH